MDENDLKIIEILDDDSRIPYDLIGKRIGLTGNAIRTRVMRLIDDGVIEDFVFKINPAIFGIETCYVKFNYPEKLNAAEIINEKLSDDPRFTEIITGIDGTTIVHVFGKSSDDLNKSIDEMASILDVHPELILKRYQQPIEESRINNSLLKIINCLIKDVRMSVADLARECNMTSKSVKYYLEQIHVKKIGRFSINLQPNKISKRIFVSVFINKPNSDYVNFTALYNSLKTDLRTVIVKDYLLVDPAGIYLNLTTESLEEIDQIEEKIRSFLMEDYSFWKMFPSKTIYRKNLIYEIVTEQIEKLDSVI